MVKEAKNLSLLGCLPKAAFWNLVVGVLVLMIEAILGGPKMTMEKETALVVFFVLIAIYLAITLWGIFSLLPKKNAGQLQTKGAYHYVRHPMYSAIVFVLNPALAILLRSWLLALTCIPIYLIWRQSVESEENQLRDAFGKEYLKYKKTTWPFFPNLFKINKPFFFAVTASAVFIVTFVVLNLPSFYVRTVQWKQENEAEEPIQRPVRQMSSSLPESENIQIMSPKPKYDKPNSVVVAKINIDAPLIFVSGTSQKELNAGLNQGVVIYPGSKMPGEPGNVFLTGHSSTYPWNKTQYGQVFALLDRLEPGDRVTIYYNQYKYEYEVTKKYVTAPDKVTIGSVGQARTLTLMTCWPIGTAWKRLVVEGIAVD